MMSAKIIGFVLLLIVAGIQNVYAFQYADAKITIIIVDEDLNPVSNALVTGGFFSKDSVDGGTDFKGYSDLAGQFSVSARTHGEASYLVRKDGYYHTSGRYREWFTNNGKVEDGRWEPWNPTIDVVLRRVKYPVPMYAKRVSTTLPFTDKPCGFDLERGDWVAPYGIGIVSDFVFNISRTGNEWENFEVVTKLHFSNEGDGIQEVSAAPRGKGSKLRLPRNAPEKNYKPKWIKKLGNNSEDGYYNLKTENNKAFIYRVRTKYDKDGKIVSARYGKIHGDIKLSGYLVPQLSIVFTYYFNPDGTRNLEFNPKQNLFRNLSSFEEVREP